MVKNYSVQKYHENDYEKWNAFIAQAKNATFLFHRDFMEYHKDRFEDYSLIVLNDEKWVAVLPANVVDNQVFSHQGLTFGGLVCLEDVKVELIETVFESILAFFKENKMNNFILKPILDFYQSRVSNELNYFLFQNKASLMKRSMNLVIDYSKPLRISKSKLKHYRRVSKLGISIEEAVDFNLFWNQILIPRLEEKYQTKPVHSLEEINQLKTSFPENIKQFNAYYEGEIVAGITLFISKKVVKSQYGATSLKGESVRVLDFLFIKLINEYSSEYSFFDMGIVDDGDFYNKGLLKQKEELGCSVYLQDVFKIELL
jgi:hypothetical protein